MKRACILVALAACHGSDATTTPDATMHEMDARPLDASPELAPLIGTWQLSADPPADGAFTQLTFDIDGSLAADTGGGQKLGIYAVPSPGRLRISDADQSDPVEVDFAIDAGRLVFGAWLAQGPVNGFVGTWKSDQLGDGHEIIQTIVIADDHTGTLQINTSAPTSATWAIEGSGFVLNTVFPYHFRPVGAVLSQETYVKQ
jgi:hypothetical protein